MAKAKKAAKDGDEDVGLDDVVSALIKEFGPVVFNAERNAGELKRMVIPYSPANDMMFGGGLKEGSSVIVNGKEKTGKTVSSLDFAATAQDMKYANPDLFPNGRRVFFFSVEGRLNERDIDGIHHMDRSRFDWIQSSPGNILSADKVLSMAERVLHQVPGCIVVIDSLSQLSSAEDMASSYADKTRPNVPVMLAKFCRQLPHILPVNKNIFIGITHRMANQGGGPSKWSEGGGNKIQYAADFKMKTSWSEEWLLDEAPIGRIIHWDCDTTALDRPVTTKAVSRFRFGYGIDKQGELIDIGESLGFVEKGGSWYTFPDYNMKAQGFEKARQLLIDNPNIYEDFNKRFRTMMGFDRYDTVKE
jgi:recombination protein RecA